MAIYIALLREKKAALLYIYRPILVQSFFDGEYRNKKKYYIKELKNTGNLKNRLKRKVQIVYTKVNTKYSNKRKKKIFKK